MHLKSTNLGGLGGGETHCITFSAPQFLLILILSLINLLLHFEFIETRKSEMSIFPAVLKESENLAVGFWHGLYFLFTLIYSLPSPLSF